MKVEHTDKEPLFFDHYSADALNNIIETQHKIIDYLKKQKGNNKLYSILVVVDDFADDPRFSRYSNLNGLYTRGRHNSISTITATQKFNAIAPIIRVNATELYIYRLRNYKDLEAFIDEVSAIADKKILLDIYKLATAEPYSFLYVNLRAKKLNDCLLYTSPSPRDS